MRIVSSDGTRHVCYGGAVGLGKSARRATTTSVTRRWNGVMRGGRARRRVDGGSREEAELAGSARVETRPAADLIVPVREHDEVHDHLRRNKDKRRKRRRTKRERRARDDVALPLDAFFVGGVRTACLASTNSRRDGRRTAGRHCVESHGRRATTTNTTARAETSERATDARRCRRSRRRSG